MTIILQCCLSYNTRLYRVHRPTCRYEAIYVRLCTYDARLYRPIQHV